MGQHGLAVWLGFTGIVVALLILDLGVLNRRSHVLSFKEAMSWSGGLITFALLFGLFLWWREGAQHALEYYTGYLIELSLSVDNLFVFVLIMAKFAVPSNLQQRVLMVGVLIALALRAVFIAAGATCIGICRAIASSRRSALASGIGRPRISAPTRSASNSRCRETANWISMAPIGASIKSTSCAIGWPSSSPRPPPNIRR